MRGTTLCVVAQGCPDHLAPGDIMMPAAAAHSSKRSRRISTSVRSCSSRRAAHGAPVGPKDPRAKGAFNFLG
jgi:hypothetical protein